MMHRRFAFLRCLVAGLVISAVSTVHAVPPTNLDLHVTTSADSGAGSLRDALEQVNAAGAGTHSITIDHSVGPIAVGSFMPRIALTGGAELTIHGGGATIDGQNQYRPFFVQNGKVIISDVTIQNGLAQGGSGGTAYSGGGGGLGAGGAVFVDATADVTLKNVHVSGNAAAGGAGGNYASGIFQRGGGGGGGLHGNGGSATDYGGGGGGGFTGNGGSTTYEGGGGGGGGTSNGGDTNNLSGGAGGGEGGNGGNSVGTNGGHGSTLGGGGGGGNHTTGGNGGDFGGGGGAGNGDVGGAGGFGGGGGGIGLNGPAAGAGGFGAGDGGQAQQMGHGGDGLGGAVFVRQGGSLTIIDSQIQSSSVTGGIGQTNGSAQGSGLYLMTGVNANFSVDAGQTSTLDDAIAGDGGLTKVGAGTLKLTGTSNYTGGTQVSDGRLAINGSLTSDVAVAAAGELGGNGLIQGNVTSNGRLAAGNSIGTLNIGGNLNQTSSSTTQVEINDGGTTAGVNNDLVHVTGTASVGGAVEVKAAPGNYTDGTQYTFLQADGGVSGTYDSISDDLAFFDAVLIYNAYNVQLMLQENATHYLAVAGTANQRGAAGYLDAHSFGATGDLKTLYDELKWLSASGAQGAFDQLGGQVYGTTQQFGLQAGTQQFQMLSNRLRPHSFFSTGGWTSSSNGLAQRASTESDSPVQLVSYSRAEPQADLTFSQGRWQPSWNGWTEGYGLGGKVDSDGNAAAASYGLGGTQFGLDRLLDSETLLGFYGGYAGASVVSDAPSQSTTQNGGRFGTYLRSSFNNDYWLWIGGLGFDAYDSRRNLQFGGISRTAQGDYDGWQAASYLERGLTFRRGLTELQPLLALQYFYLRQNSFTETGASAANLDVAGIDTHSLRLMPGTRLRRTFRTRGGGLLAPELRASWVHEFLNTSSVVTSGFAGTPGSGFTVQGANLGRDWALLGSGLSWQANRHLSLYGGYDLQASHRQSLHLGSGGLQYQW